MDFDDALALLGLDRSTDWSAVRGAYRAAMRVAHPDVASGDAEAARRLNEAFSLLEPVYRRGEAPPPPPAPARAPAADEPSSAGPRRAGQHRADLSHLDDLEVLDVRRVDDDGLALVAPADEVFYRLLEALHDLGDVVYADPEGNYLEALVHGGAGQLAVSLQGRADATEAFFTLESLRGAPVPPIDVVVRAIAERLRGCG
jgi:hypothetical protein